MSTAMGAARRDDRRPPEAVIGAGLMGHSIAGVFAAAGASVAIHDPEPGVLAAVTARVHDQLIRLGKDPSPADGIRLYHTVESAVE